MKLGQALKKPQSSLTYEPSHLLPLSRCLTGIEVEVEGARGDIPAAMSDMWAVHEDRTLRNNPKGVGVEYVSKQPLFGKDLLKSIHLLCAEAERGKWDSNYRTSIHVHIDMRGSSFEAFRNMCIAYAVTEKLLYDWAGSSREKSNFCLPWREAEADISKITELFSTQDESLLRKAENIHRYSGLNLNALAKFGSVEFRHLRTTFEAERIITWVKICQSLKKFGKVMAKANTSGFHILEAYSQKGPAGFAEYIYGKELGEELVNTASTLDLTSGLYLAIDLLREEVNKQMNILFQPVSDLFTPGTPKGLPLWDKSHKKKSNTESWRPSNLTMRRTGAHGFAPSYDPHINRNEAYQHGFKPLFHGAKTWRAYNLRTNEPIEPKLECRINTADLVGAHSYLGTVWRAHCADAEEFEEGPIPGDLPVLIYDVNQLMNDRLRQRQENEGLQVLHDENEAPPPLNPFRAPPPRRRR